VRGSRLLLLSLIVILLSPLELHAQAIQLPERMGPINDYAAQLGNEQRERLKFLVERLAYETGIEGGIQANLLITLLDPFSNTTRFASAIWDHWELQNNNTLLLVFVRDQGAWYFHWQASPDQMGNLNALVNETKIFERAVQLVRDRRISDAAVEAFEQLALNYAGPEIEEIPEDEILFNDASLESPLNPEPLDQEQDEVLFEDFSTESINTQTTSEDQTLWYALGGVGGSLVLFLLIRMAFMSSCPHCGGRLQRRDASMGRTSYRRSTSSRSKRITYCPNCRYQRTAA